MFVLLFSPNILMADTFFNNRKTWLFFGLVFICLIMHSLIYIELMYTDQIVKILGECLILSPHIFSFLSLRNGQHDTVLPIKSVLNHFQSYSILKLMLLWPFGVKFYFFCILMQALIVIFSKYIRFSENVMADTFFTNM